MDARGRTVKESSKTATAAGSKHSKLKESVVSDEPEEEKGDWSGKSGVEEENDKERERDAALEKIREVAAQPHPPSPKPSLKHLLLSVSGPPSSEPSEDMGFRLVRAAPQLSFRADEFWLPKRAASLDNTEPVVLYGLDEWDGK